MREFYLKYISYFRRACVSYWQQEQYPHVTPVQVQHARIQLFINSGIDFISSEVTSLLSLREKYHKASEQNRLLFVCYLFDHGYINEVC